MNIQKELKALDEKTQKLRNSYGRRFLGYYNKAIENKMANNRIIRDANKANGVNEGNINEATEAMKKIDYKF